MHNWNDVLDYGDQSMERALQLEKSVSEFLMDIQDKLRKKMNDKDGNEIFLKLGSEEMKLLNKFAEIKNDIHSALCNSINTRAVVEKVREIVTASNVYAMECKNVDKNVNCIILRDIAAYIVKLFKMFGAPLNGGHYFENNGSTESNNKSGVDEDEMLLPYLSALANFREKVRLSAIDNKNKDILKLCDELRDVDLFELGIKLEDKDGETVVKRVGREVLLKEREQKEAIDEAKRLKKDKNEKERLEKEAKMKVDPQIMFTIGEYASKFSAYDEKGIPTHTLDGEKLSQAQRKKMEKNWDTQRKKFEQFKGISA
uniref:DALR_2 domain-containing protein n=1 Tax=Rhabditophanes sp. KR3021 TaxID=114890 RepID=A0AC35UI62_9BILA